MPYECCVRGAYDIYAETLGPDGRHDIPGFRPDLPVSYYGGHTLSWSFFEQPMSLGIWTDDTAMVLAEMESIARLGRVDPEDIMRNFVRWNDEGAFTATGKAIGQGRRTLNALDRFKAGTPALQCGGTTERDNGDGSLMRMLPFMFAEGLMDRDGMTVDRMSALTHGHMISMRACRLYIEVGRRIARGMEKAGCVRGLSDQAPPFDRIGNIDCLQKPDVRSSGYVVDALEAALWCFLTTDDYGPCILRCVDLGGDTDTIAAIAGSLAGMYYGENAIPEQWRASIYRLEEIEALCAWFAQAVL